MGHFGISKPHERKVPGRLDYDTAFALCALGSWIIYHSKEGYVRVAVEPAELEDAYAKGATVFFESALKRS